MVRLMWIEVYSFLVLGYFRLLHSRGHVVGTHVRKKLFGLVDGIRSFAKEYKTYSDFVEAVLE